MKHVRLTSYLSEQCTTYASASIGERRQVKLVTGYFIRNVADNIIWRARRWIFSSDFDCSFVRLVCQAWHAYSKIGRTTAWKKCTRSSPETPVRFSFFKNCRDVFSSLTHEQLVHQQAQFILNLLYDRKPA